MKGRKTGGRQKGSKTKVGADLRALAQQYTAEAVKTLASIMREGDTAQARAMAADKLLDRGHGKAAQIVAGDEKRPIEVIFGFRDSLRAKLTKLAQTLPD